MAARPVMLTILDGWGIAPPGPGNAPWTWPRPPTWTASGTSGPTAG